jgi:dihydroorotate dehydrogenase
MATGPHTRVIAWLYRSVLKPALFQLDPEEVHNRFVNIGAMLGTGSVGQVLTRTFFAYEHPMLHTTVAGIHFNNPVGLAAGFDKNAHMTDIIPDVGFGFMEVGSITGKPCAGNPRPRLWRIPALQSIQVYYGLPSDGADAISEQMRNRSFRIPVGISAARTNDKTTVDTIAGIADYVHVVERFRGIGDYLAINISCPNTFCGETFAEPELLDQLLVAIDPIADKPVFVKLAVDLSPEQLDAVLDVCAKHRVDGFVCSNLSKNNTESNLPGQGGISGKPVQKGSDEQIAHIYRRTQGKYAIIGVGGIFNTEDAYRKIRRGASLVQLMTGMIYEGPQLIGQINHDLVRMLQRDGFSSVSQAVGVDSR